MSLSPSSFCFKFYAPRVYRDFSNYNFSTICDVYIHLNLCMYIFCIFQMLREFAFLSLKGDLHDISRDNFEICD